jgi:hypothetical protein
MRPKEQISGLKWPSLSWKIEEMKVRTGKGSRWYHQFRCQPWKLLPS